MAELTKSQKIKEIQDELVELKKQRLSIVKGGVSSYRIETGQTSQEAKVLDLKDLKALEDELKKELAELSPSSSNVGRISTTIIY